MIEFTVFEIPALKGAILPVTKTRIDKVKKWMHKIGFDDGYVKTIPGTPLVYVDTEAMGINPFDFIEGYTVERLSEGKKRLPRKVMKNPIKKKRITAKKCACTVTPRKKGERLPFVIGVIKDNQTGYFTGDGFDTDANQALLFVSQQHATRIAKTLKGLPRGSKLFVIKKPFGVIR